MRGMRTKSPANTLFCHGKSVIPYFAGSVFMMYSSVKNPGHSIVNQAMRPGMLSRLATEVLPMPYQPITHCAFPI